MSQQDLNESFKIGDFIEVSGIQTFRIVGYMDGDMYLRGVIKKRNDLFLSPNVQAVEMNKQELPYWIKIVPPIGVDGNISKSIEEIQMI